MEIFIYVRIFQIITAAVSLYSTFNRQLCLSPSENVNPPAQLHTLFSFTPGGNASGRDAELPPVTTFGHRSSPSIHSSWWFLSFLSFSCRTVSLWDKFAHTWSSWIITNCFLMEVQRFHASSCSNHQKGQQTSLATWRSLMHHSRWFIPVSSQLDRKQTLETLHVEVRSFKKLQEAWEEGFYIISSWSLGYLVPQSPTADVGKFVSTPTFIHQKHPGH